MKRRLIGFEIRPVHTPPESDYDVMTVSVCSISRRTSNRNHVFRYLPLDIRYQRNKNGGHGGRWYGATITASLIEGSDLLYWLVGKLRKVGAVADFDTLRSTLEQAGALPITYDPGQATWRIDTWSRMSGV